jgi:hypothetical protein
VAVSLRDTDPDVAGTTDSSEFLVASVTFSDRPGAFPDPLPTLTIPAGAIIPEEMQRVIDAVDGICNRQLLIARNTLSMAERLHCSIDYLALFSTEGVKRILSTLAGAVQDNWPLRDEWSTAEPEYPVDIDRWLVTCGPEVMQRFEGKRADQTWSCCTQELTFSFSPLSAWTAWLFIAKEHDGRVSILLSVPRGVLHEYQGEREQCRMEWEWDEIRQQRGEDPVGKRGPDEGHPSYDEWWEKWNALADTPAAWPNNKRCIEHIIEKLRTALPVRDVSIDEQLS